MRGAIVGDDAVGSSSISLVSYRVSRWACPPLRKIIIIDPAPHHLHAAMTATMDDAPIVMHGIHAGRDMKRMQANWRYYDTVVSS